MTPVTRRTRRTSPKSLEGENRVVLYFWLSKLARAKVLLKLEFDTEYQVLFLVKLDYLVYSLQITDEIHLKVI